MRTVVRIAAAMLATASLALPTAASAQSSIGADTLVMRSQTSQVNALFHTADGCVQSDLVIHGVLEEGAVSAVVQSWNACSNTSLLLTAGLIYDADIQIDKALQKGHVAGTILTVERGGSTTVPVTVDLTWTGIGGLITTPAAPGLSPDTTGFHMTTPWFNVTLTGVYSSRAASMSGSIDVLGFAFSTASSQPDFTVFSTGKDEFIVTFKPAAAG